MRKTGLFLLLAGLAVFGASCTKTDTPPNGNPISITVSPMTTTAKGGDSVTFHVTITDDNTLKDVVVSQSLGGGTETQVASYSLSGKSYSFDQGYRVPAGFTGDIKIKFLVDDASNTNTATATITVGSGSSDINAYSAVLLGSYKESTPSFYASSNNMTYNITDAKSNQGLVDMVFYYGSSNMYTLAAPSDASFGTGSGQISSLNIQDWSTKNATHFKQTSLSDLSTIKTSADISSAYSAGTDFSTTTLANQLQAGQIIAFQTAAGKMGLCKIVDVSGGDAANGKGTMHIMVDVQK